MFHKEGYRLALGRPPRESERQRSVTFLEQQMNQDSALFKRILHGFHCPDAREVHYGKPFGRVPRSQDLNLHFSRPVGVWPKTRFTVAWERCAIGYVLDHSLRRGRYIPEPQGRGVGIQPLRGRK